MRAVILAPMRAPDLMSPWVQPDQEPAMLQSAAQRANRAATPESPPTRHAGSRQDVRVMGKGTSAVRRCLFALVGAGLALIAPAPAGAQGPRPAPAGDDVTTGDVHADGAVDSRDVRVRLRAVRKVPEPAPEGGLLADRQGGEAVISEKVA
jgi:hypothetical protein